MNSRAKARWLTAPPKTLAASVVPVMVGSSLVLTMDQRPALWIAVFALLAAIVIQVGTNYINDALDFIKGADSEPRLGERRATQSGWFTARAVMAIGIACFA